MLKRDKYGLASFTVQDMAIIFKFIKMLVRACAATKQRIMRLKQLKWKLFNLIEGVTLKMKISKDNVLICDMQVDSSPFSYSLDIGWTKQYIV